MLLSWHNLAYYNRLVSDVRGAIEAGRWAEFFASQPCPLGANTLR